MPGRGHTSPTPFLPLSSHLLQGEVDKVISLYKELQRWDEAIAVAQSRVSACVCVHDVCLCICVYMHVCVCMCVCVCVALIAVRS